eukprot:Rmarinus@m.9446
MRKKGSVAGCKKINHYFPVVCKGPIPTLTKPFLHKQFCNEKLTTLEEPTSPCRRQPGKPLSPLSSPVPKREQHDTSAPEPIQYNHAMEDDLGYDSPSNPVSSCPSSPPNIKQKRKDRISRIRHEHMSAPAPLLLDGQGSRSVPLSSSRPTTSFMHGSPMATRSLSSHLSYDFGLLPSPQLFGLQTLPLDVLVA